MQIYSVQITSEYFLLLGHLSNPFSSPRLLSIKTYTPLAEFQMKSARGQVSLLECCLVHEVCHGETMCLIFLSVQSGSVFCQVGKVCICTSCDCKDSKVERSKWCLLCSSFLEMIEHTARECKAWPLDVFLQVGDLELKVVVTARDWIKCRS